MQRAIIFILAFSAMLFIAAELEFRYFPAAQGAGDVGGVMAHSRMLAEGADPLARPNRGTGDIPYPMTAATALIPLLWLPAPAITVLVIASAFCAIYLLARSAAPGVPHWLALSLLLYVPLIANFMLVQWAPLLLLSLALGFALREKHPIVAGLLLMPLLTKAQLMPMLAAPAVLVMLAERRWRMLGATCAGWAGLLAVSLALRPGWPLVWWQYASRFSGGYPAPAQALPALGALLIAFAMLSAWRAYKNRDTLLLLGALVLLAALMTPQKIDYEATVLLVPLAIGLRRPGLTPVVVALSWLQMVLVGTIAFAQSMLLIDFLPAALLVLLVGNPALARIHLRLPVPRPHKRVM
jgi:hypothetical protein